MKITQTLIQMWFAANYPLVLIRVSYEVICKLPRIQCRALCSSSSTLNRRIALEKRKISRKHANICRCSEHNHDSLAFETSTIVSWLLIHCSVPLMYGVLAQMRRPLCAALDSETIILRSLRKRTGFGSVHLSASFAKNIDIDWRPVLAWLKAFDNFSSLTKWMKTEREAFQMLPSLNIHFHWLIWIHGSVPHLPDCASLHHNTHTHLNEFDLFSSLCVKWDVPDPIFWFFHD